ncbi:hypothetical protein AAF712_000821 [Marasmius tenuissimus]|uniref:Tethering factor for nuclear proteasome STS1 n=1 Tax=Marasmius tenuissimus TaxID=585030 RepID=A0ABR3AFV7_9AGAR
MAMLSPPNTIGFQPRPVKDAPAAFGFGFGLGPMPSSHWQPQPLQPQASGFNSFASTSHNSPSRTAQKRRLDPDDGVENLRYPQDERMDRSPTPERPKRAAPKRARVSPSAEAIPKSSKEYKSRNDSSGEDVDVGMLLASLPPQSLLPILTSLIEQQPSLKPVVLSLIPRPTLESAIHALETSAKKLRDAYPYSNNNAPFSQNNASVGFGFGFGGGFNNAPVQQAQPAGGMRESYILSRLRPHITEFINATTSYLPYFSLLSTQTGISAQQSHSALHKDKTQPAETFTFLYTLTREIFSQPTLTQSSLLPHLLQRLSEEWTAWVDKVDSIVNQQGGMFGRETVESWERGLVELASRSDTKSAASRAWSRTLSSVPQTGMRHSTRDSTFSGAFRDDVSTSQMPLHPERRVLTRPHSTSSPVTQQSELVHKEHSLLPQESCRGKPTKDNTSKMNGRWRRRRRNSRGPSRADVASRSKAGEYQPTSSIYPALATSPSYLIRPESSRALYTRLRDLHARRISLPKLIDYHDWYPHLRSTRSFNFLVTLALANSNYGTAKWLVQSMELANIAFDIRTQKLIVRWHVGIGLWERAWQRLTSTTTFDIAGRKRAVEKPMEVPRQLWLEFFEGLTRGVKSHTRAQYRRFLRYSQLLVYTRRFLLLMEHQPSTMDESTRLRILHLTIHALLRLRQTNAAMELTRRYLDYLSKDPSRRRSLPQSPLKLVHLFVVFGSWNRGLRKFHEARQFLMTFLYTYSFLVPTPLTVFLLLGTLRGAKKCGTVGLDCFVYFRSRWGGWVDDQMVRRRLASLAVKEGRMDIVGKILQTVSPLSPHPNIRAKTPARSLSVGGQKPYRGKGREKALWYQLMVRRNRRLRRDAARLAALSPDPHDSELP